ncbi:MAG: hypothetical protein Tsb009_00140 [Planctomycetaceae bacterium]
MKRRALVAIASLVCLQIISLTADAQGNLPPSYTNNLPTKPPYLQVHILGFLNRSTLPPGMSPHLSPGPARALPGVDGERGKTLATLVPLLKKLVGEIKSTSDVTTEINRINHETDKAINLRRKNDRIAWRNLRDEIVIPAAKDPKQVTGTTDAEKLESFKKYMNEVVIRGMEMELARVGNIEAATARTPLQLSNLSNSQLQTLIDVLSSKSTTRSRKKRSHLCNSLRILFCNP